MESLSLFQMSLIGAGSDFWLGFGCITTTIGWVGSFAGLAIATGGLALTAAVVGHIAADSFVGVTCAAWIKSMQDN